MAKCPDQPARSTAVGCGRVELGSHVRLLILQLLEEAAWLSRSPKGSSGEDTEFLRKGPWLTADPKASSPCYSKHGPDLEGLVSRPSLHGAYWPSSILAWRIPWTEEPGRLQSTGSQRVRHGSAINTTTTTGDLRRLLWTRQVGFHLPA